MNANSHLPNPKLMSRESLAQICRDKRARGERVVFTNGCFDILHAGHVELLHAARALGDFLVVGINSDASVRALKGESRPVNDEASRAFVLARLADVDAVYIFAESTPVETIEFLKPQIHVKGGDYKPDDLPEAATVRAHGGEIHIVPLRAGFSTTNTIEKLKSSALQVSEPQVVAEKNVTSETRAVVVIPARYGATRFPGKPLKMLGVKPVIEHVARAALQSQADKPVIVATDDERIAGAIRGAFDASEVGVVMTSESCRTGTDRIAEVVAAQTDENSTQRLIVINVQGDEPFVNPRHIDALIEAMRADGTLQMATLATPINDAAQINDANIVKVVTAKNGNALLFSRAAIPFARDGDLLSTQYLRHLGVYAYSAQWLLKMAKLPPTPLEENEKLEQLRALENGVGIRVLVVEDVVNIAIDTPHDLVVAQEFLQQRGVENR